MRKWLLGVMVMALLAAPALACGFPLPAGSSMMAVSKSVCAEGEDTESCQMRQDAYQMMGKLDSVVVEDLNVDLFLDDGSQEMVMTAEGMFEYVVTDDETGLGAQIHAMLTEGEIDTDGESQSLSDIEFILVGDTGYTNDGTGWVSEELDQNTLLGLGMLLGLTGPTGTGLDLFSVPGIFTVTEGEPTEINGQTMMVQTLSLDLEALLSDADAITALMTESAAASETLNLDMSTLGDPEEIAMVGFMLIPALEGSKFESTIYIGEDDGLLHRIEDSYVFKLDMSAMGEPTAMELSYNVAGNIMAHNEELVIEVPDEAEPGEGLLGDVGGDTGLGSSLFGGN